MKAIIEIGVYHGQNSEGTERKFWRHYAVLFMYGAQGSDCATCYSLEDLEWVLRKFEQECLNREIKEIEIINWTSLNVLGFLCGETLEGKELNEEKITREDEDEERMLPEVR